MAMPLLKHGIPVAPVQLENVTAPNYLDSFKILLMTYQGMKPQTPAVHAPLADWVKRGGVLVFCDDDSDVFNSVHEWWNSDEKHFRTPREPLFAQLGFNPTNNLTSDKTSWSFGKGEVIWLRKNPARLAGSAAGADEIVELVQQAAKPAKLKWRETSSLVLRRGPYVIAAGLDESIAGEPKVLRGHFVNLFDPELRVLDSVPINPGSRYFLRDLALADAREPQLLASACKALPVKSAEKSRSFLVEGATETPAVMLFQVAHPPGTVTLDGKPVAQIEFSKKDGLLWIRFTNEAKPRTLTVQF
jgi:hypothetical protein